MTIKNQNSSDSKIESSYTNDKISLDWFTDKSKEALLNDEISQIINQTIENNKDEISQIINQTIENNKDEISQIINQTIENNKDEISSQPNTEIAVKNILNLPQNEIKNKIKEYITK